MTNPSSIVRVHSRKGGRASVYEANMAYQVYEAGVLSGTGVTPNSGLTVTVGGSGSPTVLVATDANGYKVALDLVGTANLTLTTPTSNSRITSIVAYTNDLSADSTEPNATGSPASCGLIAVNGSAGANPNPPTNSQIRSAITSDGGTGSQASYCVIANVRLTSSTSTITTALITTKHAILGMINLLYPVGSFFETTDTAFDPNVSWGGTWAEDSAGRVLVAKDNGTFVTVGSTGGSETSNHYHWQSGGGDSDHVYDLTNSGATAEGLSSRVTNKNRVSIAGSGETGAMRQTSTYPADSSTIQPYLIIKRWHRTA